MRNLFSCHFLGKKQGKPYLTFFLSDEKERTHVHFLLNGQKKVYCFSRESSYKPTVTFLLSGQKKGNRKKTRPPTLRKVCNATA